MYLSRNDLLMTKLYTHLLVALFLESCWLCRLIFLKSPIEDVGCFCLPNAFVSTFGLIWISFKGLVERSLWGNDFFDGRDVFATDSLESLSPRVLSTRCSSRYLGVTEDSESDDDGLELLISYRTLFDITGKSVQIGLMAEDALLALDNSTTYQKKIRS